MRIRVITVTRIMLHEALLQMDPTPIIALLKYLLDSHTVRNARKPKTFPHQTSKPSQYATQIKRPAPCKLASQGMRSSKGSSSRGRNSPTFIHYAIQKAVFALIPCMNFLTFSHCLSATVLLACRCGIKITCLLQLDVIVPCINSANNNTLTMKEDHDDSGDQYDFIIDR